MGKRRKKSRGGSSVHDDVMGYLASRALDNQADYIARGRSQKALAEQELTEKWVQAFKWMADDPRKREARALVSDLESEFRLRGEEPPYELVREELERYTSAAPAAIEEITQDSDEFEKFASDVAADVEAFTRARDKPKN